MATETAVGLSSDELRRYSRHLLLQNVGEEGQLKLKNARVLLIGAGGLGSPAAMYLAAAGVGTLGIVDADRVDETNLQRQILHGSSDIGRPKTDSARDTIGEINPLTAVQLYPERITSENALAIAMDYDLLVDGSDNFPTRYLINDTGVILGRPVIYGSIFRFEGQVSVFATENGPCYRCLFRDPPPPGLIPSCAEAGVFGVLPGIVGTIQATEAIKYILGVGETLVGRLLLIDALSMQFRTMEIQRDPECPACGTREIQELIDYEQFCGMNEMEETGPSEIRSITARELAQRVAEGDAISIIDVREPFEWQIAKIPGARLIPMRDIASHVDELRDARETVLYCHGGMRSLKVARDLAAAGLRGLVNLEGGIDAWSRDVDPSVPRY
ncbi:MAG: molybdopterin-synthase adenylyltransferase MoeB [Gemmatimonadaceae bacterium]|nr:molybdopterin-synthase adenylyltransferase MoeB [Gemmatimonadaceae bacterium]